MAPCLLPACVCAGAVSQPEPVYNGIRSAQPFRAHVLNHELDLLHHMLAPLLRPLKSSTFENCVNLKDYFLYIVL